MNICRHAEDADSTVIPQGQNIAVDVDEVSKKRIGASDAHPAGAVWDMATASVPVAGPSCVKSVNQKLAGTYVPDVEEQAITDPFMAEILKRDVTAIRRMNILLLRKSP